MPNGAYSPIRRYRKRCSTCQFMKKNPAFRQRIYSSTYYHPNDGIEGVQDVVLAYPGSPSPASIYKHLKMGHLDLDRERLQDITLKRIEQDNKMVAERELAAVAPNADPAILGAATAVVANSKDPYVRALDAYIRQGEEMVLQGKLQITANSFLAAVKIKADLESKQKDRGAEMIKTLAALARGTNGTPKDT